MYKAIYKKLTDGLLTKHALEVTVHGETPEICRERLEIVKDDWCYEEDFKLIALEKT